MLDTILRKAVIFTVIVTIFASLAGCGGSKKEETANGATPAPTTAVEVKPQQPVKIIALRENNGYEKNTPEEKKVRQTILDKTGIDLEMVFVPGDQVQNKQNLMLAAGEQLDLIRLTATNMVDFYTRGATIGIKEYVEQVSNYRTKMDPADWKEVTYKGELLGWPNEIGHPTSRILMVRRDWLKALGMQLPSTVEAFEKVMDAFKNNDPDKNGKNDTFPLNAMDSGSIIDFETCLAPTYLPNGFVWWLDGNKKLQPPEIQPEYKEFLIKVREWYQKGYIHPEFAVSKAEQKSELVAQIMFIFKIGDILDAGFEQVLLLYSPVVYGTGDIIDTYVYREGLLNVRYSYSTAIGMFKNVVGMMMILATNFLAKKTGNMGIW